MEVAITMLPGLQRGITEQEEFVQWRVLTRVCFLLHGLRSLLCFPGELELCFLPATCSLSFLLTGRRSSLRLGFQHLFVWLQLFVWQPAALRHHLQDVPWILSGILSPSLQLFTSNCFLPLAQAKCSFLGTQPRCLLQRRLSPTVAASSGHGLVLIGFLPFSPHVHNHFIMWDGRLVAVGFPHGQGNP